MPNEAANNKEENNLTPCTLHPTTFLFNSKKLPPKRRISETFVEYKKRDNVGQASRPFLSLRIVRLSSKRLRKAKGKQITLTERQMRIIEFINQNGKISNRNVREMFKLSNRAALDEINKLLELPVLQSQGKGRALHYIML